MRLYIEVRLEDFDYYLPPDLIAQYPVSVRDESRLMVLHRDTREIEHRIFKDIIDYLYPDDVLIINDTQVIPARLKGYKYKTGAKIEILLLRKIEDGDVWEVLIKPARRVRIGTGIVFHNSDLKGEIINKMTEGKCLIRFSYNKNVSFDEILNRVGEAPLPPYIKGIGLSGKERWIKDRYQTVYAHIAGAVAAPTAGLHFTQDLLNRIRDKGIKIIPVTLHTGLGTFRPLKTENIIEHKMDAEYYEVCKKAVELINSAIDCGKRIVAVGTTVVRVMETVYRSLGNNLSSDVISGWTDIFIYPGYKFNSVDVLLTNFHLPRTTLLMLIHAFAGDSDLIRSAYQKAIDEKYRFYSFGDAMMIF